MSESSSETIIQVHGLKKSFGDKLVVDNVNLDVRKGEVFGFLGPNGSGKTTTIRIICGLLKADEGVGSCMGYDILTQSDEIKKRIGYMAQRFSLYFDLSIEENLNFIAQVYEIKDRKRRVEEALHSLGLYERRTQLAGSLSGGWKQRVALAACLLHDPELLLLDEPTAGVDPIARREFWDQIHMLSVRGITTFVSTHYMDEAERCTRIAYLAYGKLLITGTVEEVIATTHLKTWKVEGAITTFLLQEIKKLPGVIQSALFGSAIHVCGYDSELIEKNLAQLCEGKKIIWTPINTTLEDAFISLVSSSGGAVFD